MPAVPLSLDDLRRRLADVLGEPRPEAPGLPTGIAALDRRIRAADDDDAEVDEALPGIGPVQSFLAEPRRSEPWLMASVRLSITRTKGMIPLVLPLRPTGSPMPRTLPQ